MKKIAVKDEDCYGNKYRTCVYDAKGHRDFYGSTLAIIEEWRVWNIEGMMDPVRIGFKSPDAAETVGKWLIGWASEQRKKEIK